MAKVAFHTPMGLKFRAFIDDALSSVVGRRVFTDVVTDKGIKDRIARARRSSGHKGVLSKNLARSAAAARRELKKS